MNIDKIEQLIQKAKQNYRVPTIPDKNKVWYRLSQQMDIIKSDLPRHQSVMAWDYKKFLFNLPKFSLGRLATFSVITLLFLTFVSEKFNYKIASARMGENNSLELPDGSTIILNSDSRIKYSKKFNISNRTIDLEGEAYFDIKKGDFPFIVNTDYATITVFGTSFNVRSREDGFELGVNSGVVSVSNDITSTDLLKGQLIHLKSDLDIDLTPQKSYSNYPGWINKKFYCEKTTLSELSSEIERRFNIKIKFSKPELRKITITGIIDAPNLNTVLRTISLLTQHEFKLNGDLCTIF